ncbi:MAG: family 16 glycosylhydrolase [Mycolicibacterium sp.]|uniref:family 16 glycosylhydrolase n=1 Tax=Mycolicibacterium sp. TaxID=2320850 RepID=UPI003D13E658
MNGASYIGWVGSLAVALGLAGAGAAPPAIGWADPSGADSDSPTSKTATTSTAPDASDQPVAGHNSSPDDASSPDGPDDASPGGIGIADSDPGDELEPLGPMDENSSEVAIADGDEVATNGLDEIATFGVDEIAVEEVTENATDRAESTAAVALSENLAPPVPIAPPASPAPMMLYAGLRREADQSLVEQSVEARSARADVTTAAPLTPGPVAAATASTAESIFTLMAQWWQRTFFAASPVFAPQTVSLILGSGASSEPFELAATDADTDTLIYTIARKSSGTGTAGGMLSIVGESASYTPVSGWDGVTAYADVFTVTASDRSGGLQIHGFADLLYRLTFGLLGRPGHLATSTVTVNVNPISQQPPTEPEPPAPEPEPEPEPPAPEPEPPAPGPEPEPEPPAPEPEPEPEPPAPEPEPEPEPPAPEPETPAPPEPEPSAGPNLLLNPTFANGLSGWQSSGDVSAVVDGGDAAVRLAATGTTDARISQRITNLKPQTLYTLALTMRTSGSVPSDVWGVWGVIDGPQLDKTGSGQSPTLAERRLTVYTGATDTEVTVFVAAGRNTPAGVVTVTDLRFVEGPLDPPVVDPGAPGASPPALVSLPAAGQNLVNNGRFASDARGWVLDQAARQPDGTMRIISTPQQTGRIAQDLPMLLAPNRDYVLSARARVDSGDATITVASPDGSLHAWQLVTGTSWQPVEIAFTTPDRWVSVKVTAENWRGDHNALYVDDFTLLANGQEWLDTPNPYPSPQPALFDDFSNGIDPDRWLIADKAWGGNNGGVVPANVSVVDGIVRLAAHGDQYTGDVTGHGGRTTRVGATIVTRDYYASGRYEVRARVPQTLGAASAFWSYHYIEYHPAQPEYWNEPNRIRNSEIDWEFPTARDDGTPNDPVSFDYARANTWGGKFGGEGGNVSLRPDIGELVADGEFHTYAYEWHAGGDGRAPFVAWSIDGVEVARYTGETFGQDNVPYRASRFWIGIWFPASGYRNQVGWAGDPDFDTIHLDIDWVRITPSHAPDDVYEPETWPNGFYATPDEYPQ